MNKSPRAQRRSPGYDVQRFKKIFKKLPIAEADKPKGGAIVTILVIRFLARVHDFLFPAEKMMSPSPAARDDITFLSRE